MYGQIMSYLIGLWTSQHNTKEDQKCNYPKLKLSITSEQKL